jgi:hypothetical protein
MKSIKTLLPLAILLILGVIYFMTKDAPKDSSISIDDRDFVVENREDIDIIRIKRPGYPEIHLSKKGEEWFLNQRRKASSHIVRNILTVLTKLELDYIPPNTTYPKIMKDIELLGIDVTTYDKAGNVLSDFIVGKNNNVESGTYCLKKGAKQPYVMILPSVSGGIRNYFTLTDLDLRDKTVMNVKSSDIVELTMDFKKDRKNSFQIIKEGSSYGISPLVPTANTSNISQNQNVLSAYMKNFKGFGAEGIMTGKPEMDSIYRKIPGIELDMSMKNGSKRKFSFYPVVYRPGEDDPERTTAEDMRRTEKFYMFSDDGESYIVQQRVMNKFIQPLSYFGQ